MVLIRYMRKRMMIDMKLYMLVTKDEYELPLCVAGSLDELAEMVHSTKNSIASAISHAKQKGKKCKYVKVEID